MNSMLIPSQAEIVHRLIELHGSEGVETRRQTLSIEAELFLFYA
jgi:hypothetical protein